MNTLHPTMMAAFAPFARHLPTTAMRRADPYPVEEICNCCSGSGEGQFEGTTCRSCNGTGVERVQE